MKNSLKLLNKIQLKKITPISKINFIIKNLSFWTILIFSIILWGLAFSIILFSLTQTEFDLLSHVSNSKIEFFLTLLPVFWIVLCIIFFFISKFWFKHIKQWYKYQPLTIFSIIILLSVIIGSLFFFTNWSEKLERIFSDRMPFYHWLEEKRNKRWSMAEQWFLAGTIIEKNENLLILSLRWKTWKVDIQNADIKHKVKLELNEKIKIIGKIVNKNEFTAKEIRSFLWKGKNRWKRNSFFERK